VFFVFSPRREYYAPTDERVSHERATHSPPEPEDDYVAEDLPSMAMDHHRQDSGDESNHSHSRPLDDIFASDAPPEKQRRIEERDPLVFCIFISDFVSSSVYWDLRNLNL